MRRPVHVAPANYGERADALSGVQETGAQIDFNLQLTHQVEAAVRFRSEERRLHGFETSEQGRVRATVGLAVTVAVLRAEGVSVSTYPLKARLSAAHRAEGGDFE